MITIVITGGIGSGKSLLCGLLSQHGIPVYDSDAAAKSLYDRDPSLSRAVADALGADVLDEDGMIDREALAAKVFSSAEALSRLEAIVHPAVYEDFAKFCKDQPEETKFVAFESAIVLDRGMPEGFADEIVFVDAPKELRILRAARRDGRERDEIASRAAVQRRGADDPRVTEVVVNDGTIDQLREKAIQLIVKLNSKYYEDRSC